MHSFLASVHSLTAAFGRGCVKNCFSAILTYSERFTQPLLVRLPAYQSQ